MSCSITDATAPALIPASAGEQLNWRTARPELVEGRADGSWFDKLTTSGRSATQLLFGLVAVALVKPLRLLVFTANHGFDVK